MTTVEARHIKDFSIEDKIDGFFVIRKVEVREFTRGQFVSLELGDSTGRINAVLWEPDQFALTELTESMVVKVRGQVGEYNNKRQITLSKMRLALENEYKIEDILPHSSQSREERQARLFSLTEKIENNYIKTLVNAFWQDPHFLDKFLVAPAGKLWHHAYIGGLSEHSASVAELAIRVAVGYEHINKDYLIFGGLLHDAGKIDTYTSDMVIDFTDEGRLVGHICLADHWICQRAAQIPTFPDSLLMKLRHMLLAHQGEYQNQSPVRPQMAEAFLLYYCDEIDAKMNAIDRYRARQQKGNWSEFVKLLDRHLYFGNDGAK
ncbi:MAG: OB-fold nucleic acid binding domain-containing protein [candidate division Zixibacteria bacterium]|nr:OB-fold nucleic acid binding domain-containing protein [candidate division Zixibacteria bacterium]